MADHEKNSRFYYNIILRFTENRREFLPLKRDRGMAHSYRQFQKGAWSFLLIFLLLIELRVIAI